MEEPTAKHVDILVTNSRVETKQRQRQSQSQSQRSSHKCKDSRRELAASIDDDDDDDKDQDKDQDQDQEQDDDNLDLQVTNSRVETSLMHSDSLGSMDSMQDKDLEMKDTGVSDSTDNETADTNPMAEYNFMERQAARLAECPWTFMWVVMIICSILSIIGMTLGDFTVNVENQGWQSRGTLIANRQAQFLLTYMNRRPLWNDKTGEYWDELINNVQDGWQTGSPNRRRRRRLAAASSLDTGEDQLISSKSEMTIRQGPPRDLQDTTTKRHLPFHMSPSFKRRLQSLSNTSILAGCDISWYSGQMVDTTQLWPIWRPKDFTEPNTLINEKVFLDLCLAEEKTQSVLVKKDSCIKCSQDRCLPPYSIVFYARVTLYQGLFMNCRDLAQAWGQKIVAHPELEEELVQCTKDMIESYEPWRDGSDFPPSCPLYFSPVLIDRKYGDTAQVQYTSSIFATTGDWDQIEELYHSVGEFGHGTGEIEGVYDTQYQDFVDLATTEGLHTDMIVAFFSAVITISAIVIHTRSPFLTLMAVIQISLTFPVSFFIYIFILRLQYFPFLNFLGLFIVFALGSDDVFVAVDKWKNTRHELGKEVTTAQVAAAALPDASLAMFLTSFTTAVAFYSTANCAVAPILCFAIFCGTLITMNYVLNVLIFFPSLCVYDKWRHTPNSCCHCLYCHASTEEQEEEEGETLSSNEPSLINRVLTTYYNGLHKFRFVVLLVSIAATAVSIAFATKMRLPTSSDVRLLHSDVEYEKNYQWRKNILFEDLNKATESSIFIIWGVTPADTGDQKNPYSFTSLVLDESFQPSKTDAQVYLLNFCDNLYTTDWAKPIDRCPMQDFDAWLRNQSLLEVPDQIYTDYCGNAYAIPMDEIDFDACMYNWGQETSERYVLARNGKIQIMYFRFTSRIRYDSPFSLISNEWHTMENWFQNQTAKVAPASARNMYFTSRDVWWYDTNNSMLMTAWSSGLTAILCAAAVILVTSRSFMLTLFSSFTIVYVLASVTAILVALGWTLGFLEAICFSILIGISCDFVIHFTHSYGHLPGSVDKYTRTKFAIINMGPSIIAGTLTTAGGAVVMFFTKITFFLKFGIILCSTVMQALIGSFVIFLACAECCGPAEPAHFVDSNFAKLRKKMFPNSSNNKEGKDGIPELERGFTEDMWETIKANFSPERLEI